MTNEEIFKYADKALKKQEQRFNSIFVGTFVMFFIGYKTILLTLLFANYTSGYWLALLCIIGSLVIYLICLTKYSNRHNKMRREFTYNLVRKDERQRIASEELFGR